MKPTLTLLIPCFNEANRLPKSLEQLKSWIEANTNIPTKLMIVDDGSTDKTKHLIKSFPLEIEIISLEVNIGKGGAIAAGIKEVKTDLVLAMDIDLATCLVNINTFYQEMINSSADLIVANRFDPKSKVTNFITRKLSSRLFQFIVHKVIKFKTQDTQCGFKLFKTNVAKDLFSNLNFLGFSFDLEVLQRAESKYQIHQMPVEWTQKDGSRVRIIRDGLQMIIDLFKLKRRQD